MNYARLEALLIRARKFGRIVVWDPAVGFRVVALPLPKEPSRQQKEE
jgi:hypothetical protein